MGNKKTFFATSGLLLAVVIPFGVWLARYLNLDFWYDEVYTLKQYVFVPLAVIPTHYPNPNNHIFFNLINHLFVTALGIRDLSTLMAHPETIRGLMMAYTVLTLACLGWLCFRFFNHRVAVLALLCLVTSVPYYNFVLQVRGYSLSLLLAVWVLYCLLASAEKLTWKNGIGLVTFTALLVYTVPSNLYLIASMILFLGLVVAAPALLGFYRRLQAGHTAGGLVITLKSWFEADSLETAAFKSYPFREALLLGAGCLLAGLFYLPVMRDVFQNAKTQGVDLFSLKTRLLLFPRTMNYFFSFRYALLPLAVLGLAACIRSKQRIYLERCLFCMFVMVAPFAMNFVLWNEPADRVFVVLLIPFVLLLAMALDGLIGAIPWLAIRPWFALVLAILYCQATFFFALENRDARLLADIHQAQVSQNLFYNYYQAFYQPSRIMALYKALDPRGLAPLTIFNYGDGVAVPAYLDQAGIQTAKVASTSQIRLYSGSPTYVLTAFPDLFIQLIHRSYKNADCELAQAEVGFTNLFKCSLSLP
ncbi:MAG TPA: hypothetical protein VF326_05460 [Anaerolineaceae bacterium]